MISSNSLISKWKIWLKSYFLPSIMYQYLCVQNLVFNLSFFLCFLFPAQIHSFSLSSQPPSPPTYTHMCVRPRAHAHTHTNLHHCPASIALENHWGTPHVPVRNLLMADDSCAMTEAVCFRGQSPAERNGFTSSPKKAHSFILLPVWAYSHLPAHQPLCSYSGWFTCPW